MSSVSSALVQQYRERARAMRKEAEWAENEGLKNAYRDMAKEWDAGADKLERTEKPRPEPGAGSPKPSLGS